jgi:hypothetical protein
MSTVWTSTAATSRARDFQGSHAEIVYDNDVFASLHEVRAEWAPMNPQPPVTTVLPSGGSREKLAVEIAERPRHVRSGESAEHKAATARTHPPLQLLVVEQLPDPGGQSTRVVRWHQEARLARDHRFADATDIGRDDRLLGKKCLEHRQGESFEAGGQDEDVERTHVRSDLVAPPGPDGSIGHAQASRQTLQLLAILSVTDDDNRRILDVAHRPQKNVETF